MDRPGRHALAALGGAKKGGQQREKSSTGVNDQSFRLRFRRFRFRFAWRRRFSEFRERCALKQDLRNGMSLCTLALGGELGVKSWVEGTNVHVRHLVAGATASVVARTILAPLERVKVELQLNQQPGGAFSTAARVITKEGIGGLWKGNGLNLLRTAPYRSINYFTYDNTKEAICKITGNRELSNTQRLFAGATAGFAAIICCFPLDVLRTRMLSKGGEEFYRRGILPTLTHIIRGEGFGAFYAGVLPALISVIPSNAVFYTVYDSLKTHHLNRQRRSLSRSKNISNRSVVPSRTRQLEMKKEDVEEVELEMDPRFNLVYGGLAGIAAETSVYPLEVLRRRTQLVHSALRNGALDIYMKDMMRALTLRQEKQLGQLGGFKSMTTLLRCIITREGLKGFYWGIFPTACQVLPSAAISYYIFEECKKRLKVDK